MIERYIVAASEGDRRTFDWGDIVWMDDADLTDSDTLTVGKVTIEAGKRNEEHRHPNCDEALYLLKGRLRHTLGEESSTLEPGDLIHIPAGKPHGAKSVGEEDAAMLVVYDTGDREFDLLE